MIIKWLQSKFTKEVFREVELRQPREYKLVRGGKYSMHKGHKDNGFDDLYQYGVALGKPLVCNKEDVKEIYPEWFSGAYRPIAITLLDPDELLTSSLWDSITPTPTT